MPLVLMGSPCRGSLDPKGEASFQGAEGRRMGNMQGLPCLPPGGWHSMSSAYEAPFLMFGNKSLFMELFCCKRVCWSGASSRADIKEAGGRRLISVLTGPPNPILGHPSCRQAGLGPCPPIVLHVSKQPDPQLHPHTRLYRLVFVTMNSALHLFKSFIWK